MNALICGFLKNEADKLAAMMEPLNININCTVFSKAQQVLDYVHSGKSPDACFLDIIMPETSGITLAQKLRADGYKGAIVFISSSNDYASQSYQVKAFDYILKPVTQKAVHDVLTALDTAIKNTDNKTLVIKAKTSANFILFRDISFIEADDHTVHIRMINNTELKAYVTFSELAKQLLNDKRFMQCHRSFIINMNNTAGITTKEITMKSGARIPVSRGYSHIKDEIPNWILSKQI